MNEMKIAMG
jgi:hypothetical protein